MLGTSGQLSIVRETPFAGSAIPGKEAADGSRCEYRPYPDGRTLECRASLLGGASWAALKDRLGCSWEAMNATDDPTDMNGLQRTFRGLVQVIVRRAASASRDGVLPGDGSLSEGGVLSATAHDLGLAATSALD